MRGMKCTYVSRHNDWKFGKPQSTLRKVKFAVLKTTLDLEKVRVDVEKMPDLHLGNVRGIFRIFGPGLGKSLLTLRKSQPS